jgi:hypothetical protein
MATKTKDKRYMFCFPDYDECSGSGVYDSELLALADAKEHFREIADRECLGEGDATSVMILSVEAEYDLQPTYGVRATKL